MIELAGDRYSGRLLYCDEFCDPSEWRQLDSAGAWDVSAGGITGQWLSDSPSLFFQRPIEGNYLWQITVRRLPPSGEDLERMRVSKHWQDADPALKYNYNFWLRAGDPSGSDFLETYPSKLGTGWNGMGDDYWDSLFTTVVWNPDSNWVRLRRSPGYVKERDAQGLVPHLPYDQPHVCSFAVRDGQVRMYYDDQRVYDWRGEYAQVGYIGLCVWLCTIRFTDLKLYRL